MKTNQKTEYIDLRDIIKLVWREKVILIFCILISLFLGSYYLKEMIKPSYKSSSTFGFQDSNSSNLNSSMNQIQGVLGLPAVDNSLDLLSQISGGVFLEKVVKKLDLTNDPEFYMPLDRNISIGKYQRIKNKIKELLNYNQDITFNENSNYIVVQTTENLKKHLKFSKVPTGGFKVEVISKDPYKSSIIANNVVKMFLDFRLENKILKSEKTLSYLSSKLSKAKIEMDNANKEVELFALERNILSNQEFANQSNRLKEFRNTIDKLNLNISELEKKIIEFGSKDLNDLINEKNLEEKFKELFELSPRLSIIKNFSTQKDENKLKLEIQNVINRLPKELDRLKESLRVTVLGFNELEKKAKETSVDARELKKLERNAATSIAQYEVLLKQFEAQSLLEGYQKAMGEIYQKAVPNLMPFKPKPVFILLVSLIMGILIGLGVIVLKFLFSKSVYKTEEFSNFLELTSAINLSHSFNKSFKIIKSVTEKNLSNGIKKDLLLLQGFLSEINLKKSKDHPQIITCASTDKGNLSTSLSIAIAEILNGEGKKSIIMDFSSLNRKNEKHLIKLGCKKSNYDKKIFELNENIFYSRIVNDVNEVSLDYKNNIEILIKIVDLIDKDPLKIRHILRSNCFFLISNAGKITSTQLERIRTGIGTKISDCITGILVSR